MNQSTTKKKLFKWFSLNPSSAHLMFGQVNLISYEKVFNNKKIMKELNK